MPPKKKNSLKDYIYQLYQEDIKHPLYDPNKVKKAIYAPNFTEAHFTSLINLPSKKEKQQDEELNGNEILALMPGKMNYKKNEHITFLIHQINEFIRFHASQDLFECKFLVPQYLAGFNSYDYNITFKTIYEIMKQKKNIKIVDQKPYIIIKWEKMDFACCN